MYYNISVNYEWDVEKNERNIQKHGIDFKEASTIFDDYTFTFIDDRFDYGEIRQISIGITSANLVVIVVVHTDRNDKIRIISARKANLKERIMYETRKN